MASIIDAARNVFGDSFPIVKLGFVAIFLFISYDVWSIESMPIFFKIAIWSVTFFYFFGFMIITLHNTLNDSNKLMPNCFDFIQIFIAAVNGLSALSPICILSALGFFSLQKSLPFEPLVNNIVMGFVMAIFFSIFAMQFLLFAKDFNLRNTYNYRKVSNCAGDILVKTIGLAISMTLLIGIAGGVIGFVVYTLFGFGQILNYYITLVIVFAFMIAMQYYAQIYFEFIDLEG